MFTTGSSTQQYIQDLYHDKYTILAICALALKIYRTGIIVYEATRQNQKRRNSVKQYAKLHKMFWYIVTTKHNISTEPRSHYTIYYCGKYKLHVYHTSKLILYNKENDPYSEVLFDYAHVEDVAADIDKSQKMLQTLGI